MSRFSGYQQQPPEGEPGFSDVALFLWGFVAGFFFGFLIVIALAGSSA